MKNIYTWAAQPAQRNITVGEIIAAKGKKVLTQVTANNALEAKAAEEAGFDMIIGSAYNVKKVREGSKKLFYTAALELHNYPTAEDVLRGAFTALENGADAVMTARSMDVVSMLAKEDVPVMGHLGLVPRKSTWIGGLRAVGKTAEEAYELYKRFKRLEEAGAFSAECEVIPENVMGEISKRTKISTFGVVYKPKQTTFRPIFVRVSRTKSSTILPEILASLPTTILLLIILFSDCSHKTNDLV